jgi:hypothetical protein
MLPGCGRKALPSAQVTELRSRSEAAGFLAEKGERTYHGNFSWGYMLAVYLVWYTAVRAYLKLYFSEQMTGNKRGVGFVLATIVLALHLLSGLYYLIYLIALGHGM